MLLGEPQIPRQVNIPEASGVDVRSPSDGVLLPLVMPGDEVAEGHPFARLMRLDTGTSDLLTSPVDGVVFKLGPLDKIQKAMDIEGATKKDRYDRDPSGPVRADELVAVIYEIAAGRAEAGSVGPGPNERHDLPVLLEMSRLDLAGADAPDRSDPRLGDGPISRKWGCSPYP